MARTLLDKPNTYLDNVRLCEWGAGTGLVTLAAAAGGAQAVVATDYEAIPLQLLNYAHQHLNPLAARIPIETELFDLLLYDTQPLPAADVYVAADVMYEPRT